MEREVKIRKKRFAAFWMALALVCCLAAPIAVNAAGYTIQVAGDVASGLPQTLYAGDTMTYGTADGTTGAYGVNYTDNDSFYYFDSADYGAAYTVLAPTDPNLSDLTIPEGYTFTGWNVTSVYVSSEALASVTLSPQFTANSYTISYELDGGTNDAGNPGSYTYGVGVATLAGATKTGYTFGGWLLNGSPVTAIGTDQTGDITLSAQWTANSYTISYELYGGTNGNNPNSYTYGTGVASFAAAAKEGYTFEGWYGDDSFTTKVESVDATRTESITLYAKFTRKITYALDGGTNGAGNPESYVEGIGVASLAEATRTGYTFGGWQLNGSTVTSIGADQTGDITLSAQWTPNSYPISYELDGGTNDGSNPGSFTYGTGAAGFAPAVKAGYTFEGWYSNADFTTKVEAIPATRMEPITLYAKFRPYLIGKGTYELEQGVQYQLDSGVTLISGDGSVYSAGITFYVPASGSYTFE